MLRLVWLVGGKKTKKNKGLQGLLWQEVSQFYTAWKAWSCFDAYSSFPGRKFKVLLKICKINVQERCKYLQPCSRLSCTVVLIL